MSKFKYTLLAAAATASATVGYLGYRTGKESVITKTVTQVNLLNTDEKVRIVPKELLQFRKGHEDIDFNSLNLRHRKYDEYKTSKEAHKVYFVPGGFYNSYYLNQEPIKVWKRGENTFVIQDGHRRYIEGTLQGYKDFLVEVTGQVPEGVEGVPQVGFHSLFDLKNANAVNGVNGLTVNKQGNVLSKL